MRSFRTLLLGFALSIFAMPVLAMDTAVRWLVASEPMPTAAQLTADKGLHVVPVVLVHEYDILATSSTKSPGNIIAERLSGFTATSYDVSNHVHSMPADAIAYCSEVRPATIVGSSLT